MLCILYQVSKNFEVGYKLLVYGHLALLLGLRESNDLIEQRYGVGSMGDLIRFKFPKLNLNIVVHSDMPRSSVHKTRLVIRIVPVEPSSRKYTAFISEWDIFEYNVMPMGLTNVTANFQSMIDTIFHDIN